MKFATKGLLAFVAGSSLFAFQNCSQASFSSSTSDSVASRGGPGSDSGATIKQELTELQPAMAVRSANCINCHGNSMAASLITDFGYGDSYYFGTDNRSPVSGDWVYSLRIAADQSSSTYTPNWAQTQQYSTGASIVVPNVNLGFTYRSKAPSWAPASAAGWLDATTLPHLIQAIEALPGAGNTPVVVKTSVYIGAPSVSQLRVDGGIDPFHPLKYYPNDAQSPALSGFAEASGGYFTNTGTLICDGDLFVDGTVFLNMLTLTTVNGCRLHATGPIFVQQRITYSSGAPNPNLQLVSARLISMGIGTSHCEAATNPAGWYNQPQNNGVTDPLRMRLTLMSDPSNAFYKDIRTRNSNPTSNFEHTAATALAEGTALYAEGAKIAGLSDASCHGRNVNFEHLLLVAPLLHSRYTGSVTGVIIGEFPLFSLGAFSFAFDTMFEKVPVLPRVPASEFLLVH